MPKMITYRGRKMIAGWPKVMRDAQLEPTMVRKGVEVDRIRYGSEPDATGSESQYCRDCSVEKGQVHVWRCCVERCPICGWQPVLCGCLMDDEDSMRTLMEEGQSLPWVDYWADDQE